MVKPGPSISIAKFSNKEEVELESIYYDPIHDFGFFRFDPKSLKYQQKSQITLTNKVKVGMAIRVVGNNAGEKISILQGTLARIDRSAPKYGVGKYNDHNTFYYQAASMTSGGSSGSPVIDLEGQAIALNAGSSKTSASSFYLPLDYPIKVLEIIQSKEKIAPIDIPRGTIQVLFSHESFDQLKRMNFNGEIEDHIRKEFVNSTGLFVCKRVMIDGPADKKLQVGDVLVKINDDYILSFTQLETLFDDHINEMINIEVDRAGSIFKFDVKVQSLYEITPTSYFEFGGSLIHPISYQQALSYQIEVKGIVVSKPGYIFNNSSISKGAVISKIGNLSNPTLKEFVDFTINLPTESKILIGYWYLGNKNTTKSALITVNRRWFEWIYCQMDFQTGKWNSLSLTHNLDISDCSIQSTTFPKYSNVVTDKISKSLVVVHFHSPYPVCGCSSADYIGTGLLFNLIYLEKKLITYNNLKINNKNK